MSFGMKPPAFHPVAASQWLTNFHIFSTSLDMSLDLDLNLPFRT